ncbi:MAG: hypothetical protein F4049_01390 [Gemmatimonadetes bacterium]|nr:hypothetical protein [Gemmatimonadota bacterium]
MRYIVALWTVGSLAVGAGDLSALTIYRIGGVDQPAPELASVEGVEFVQIDWADIDEDLHGSINLLEVTSSHIEPRQLDSTVNLTPLLPQADSLGDIFYLTWIGWGGFNDDDELIWDEDPNTAYLGDGRFASHGPNTKNLIFDFGGLFFIDRVKFYPRPSYMTDRFVERFIIGTSDGDPLKDPDRALQAGSRGDYVAFDVIYNIRDNTQPIIDLKMPDEPIRKLLFRAPENTRGIWELAELELYGSGFAPFSNYTSSIIDLGKPVALGDLSWSGEVDAGAQIDLVMRSGDVPDPSIYWRFTFRGDEQSRFDAKGQPLTARAYDRLNKGEKAGITPDTQNWELWSQAYDFVAGSGAMQADRPRRYVQLKADITARKDAGGRLDFLQFRVSDPPVATQVLAEITPPSARAGDVTQFTYSILPQFEREDLGFDTIEIETPVEVTSIDGVRIAGQEVGFEVVRSDAAGFALKIPRMDVQQTSERIEVDFAVEVFKFGTVFAGRISDSEKPFEVRQALTPGDANPLTDSNTLSVELAEVGEKAVNALKLSSSVFTPTAMASTTSLRLNTSC